MSNEEEENRQEELAQQTIDQTDTGTVDPTNSNTAANSSLKKTLEELVLGAERNVIYRYSVSGMFYYTYAWKKASPLLKRAASFEGKYSHRLQAIFQPSLRFLQ